MKDTEACGIVTVAEAFWTYPWVYPHVSHWEILHCVSHQPCISSELEF